MQGLLKASARLLSTLVGSALIAGTTWLSAAGPGLAQGAADKNGATDKNNAAINAYPNRPVRVIIPLGAGGGSDIFTRVLADELQKRFGQPFIVENRTGGGLNIGTRACAEATPDGYTVCVLSSEPIVYSQFLFKTLPYDPEKDFEPIANLFFNTNVLAVNSSLKVRTIPDLIDLAKAGTLSYSTFSFPLAYFMEKLKTNYGVDIVRVPYRSGNEVVNALLSGATPVTLLGLANMIPQLQSGRVTALAVNANERSPLFPETPTLQEAIGQSYPQAWFGLFAPTGTPRPIVDKLAAEVARITADPGFSQRNYIDRAVERAVTTPDAFARFIMDDRASAEKIVKASGYKPE
jgi:tripartite-type tricarboxylate transporter receptor subunit TctC